MLTLSNNLGEERKLLGSSFGRTPEGVTSDKSEKCDESINFESYFSFEEESNDESSRQKECKQKEQSSSETQNTETKWKSFFTRCLTKAQNLLTFNRKFSNFKQLYQQIFFDGFMTVYFLKMRSRCQKYVETSFKDEQLMREISRDLQKDSFHYYNISEVGNRCIVWGKLNEWNEFANRKDGKLNNKTPREFYTLSSFGKTEEIKIQSQDPASIFSEESQLKTFTKRGILYRLITSLYALNLFKVSVQPGNVQVKFGFVYIFGEKAKDSTGKLFIKAQRIFQRVNYRNYRRDQTLFSAFGVIVGFLGLYFISKTIKNTFMCAKKKKLVDRIKEFFVKPKKEDKIPMEKQNDDSDKYARYQQL